MYNLKKNIQIFIFSISTCICFNLIFKNFRNLINFQTLKDLNGKKSTDNNNPIWQRIFLFLFTADPFMPFIPPCILFCKSTRLL